MGPSYVLIPVIKRTFITAGFICLLVLAPIPAFTQILTKGPYLILPDDNSNSKMTVLWWSSTNGSNAIAWYSDAGYTNQLGSGNSTTLLTPFNGEYRQSYTITGLSAGTKYYYRVNVGGTNYDGSFNTAPSSSATSTKFSVYTDPQTLPANHNTVAGSIIAGFPDGYQTLLLCSGDLTDDDTFLDTFFDWSESNNTNLWNMLRNMPFQSAMGNHDIATNYTTYFPYLYPGSERYYSFDYGPAHIAVADFYSWGPLMSQTQKNWLINDLASSSKPWKFINVHSSGYAGDGIYASVNPDINDIITALNAQNVSVPIVFGGHYHYYVHAQHTEPNGFRTRHITNSTTGSSFRTGLPNSNTVTVINDTRTFSKVEIINGCVTNLYTINGETGATLETIVIDRPCGVVSSRISGCTAMITWSTSLPSGSSVIYGTSTSYGSSAPGNDDVTSHSVTLTGLTPNTTYHYRVQSNGECSGDYTFTTLNVRDWTGGYSNEWFNGSNWYGGSVPTSSTNVAITSAAFNQPLIPGSTTAVCNNISIYPGASLTIAPLGRASVNALTNNGTINLTSNSSGMFSLMFSSYSGTTGIVNSSIFLTGGIAGTDMWRWHYFAVPSLQNKNVLTTSYGNNLLRYDDRSGITDINGGWQWHDGWEGTTAFSNLTSGNGYSFYYNENTTINFNTPAGSPLLANLPSKSLTFNSFGWNLIGNSLTCGIDWDDVTFSGNVDHTVFFLKDYQEYYYLPGGPGSPYGTYDGHIPPLQGFFVKANSTGASISFTNAREHNTTPYYKGEETFYRNKVKFPIIRLALLKDTLADETVVWFHENATIGNDNEFDAEKWTSEGNRPQIYSLNDNKEYVINGIPFPDKSTDIPLAFWAPTNGKYSIKQIQLENVDNYSFYLKDLSINTTVDLNTTPEYFFAANAGRDMNRFILTIERNVSSGKPFNIYSSSGNLKIELQSDEWEGRKGSIKVFDLMGRILTDKHNIVFTRNSPFQLHLSDDKGIFMVELTSSPQRYIGRVIAK
jgi:hypothetical protein